MKMPGIVGLFRFATGIRNRTNDYDSPRNEVRPRDFRDDHSDFHSESNSSPTTYVLFKTCI